MSEAEYGYADLIGEVFECTVLQRYPDGDIRVQLWEPADGFQPVQILKPYQFEARDAD